MDYLKITRTFGEIGVRTTPAKMKIQSGRPSFKIKQRPPEMIVTRKNPRVVIDKTRAFADRGNKTIFQLMDEFAKWASDVCAEAIARIAEEGTKVSKAGQTRGEVIRQIIIDRMTEKKSRSDVNITFAEGPHVEWEEGALEINWIIHQPEIEWEISARAEIEVEPHNVEVYMRKYPSLKIEVVRKGDKQPPKVNRKV